ncbi:hypothetical protein HBA93_19560, partial [Ochrobactrum sp. SFR4]|nr:hypothetical protein [Ochrobactrum sp. SFR4]
MREKKNNGNFDRKAVLKQHAPDQPVAPAEKVELSPLAVKVAAQYRNESISPALFTGLMRIWEFLVVFLCGSGFYLAYVGIQE